MSENGFEPKIVAYVCNWCTYLGADLAGTARLEYPSNVRIIRLPCTGRIDFNLVVKAFEIGADSVIVSGCHPGDCHYTSGNYHARRRWILFRALLDVLGFDLRRIHFTWVSAAEGRKWQEVVTEVTAKTRELGPYSGLYQPSPKPVALPVENPEPFAVAGGEQELRDRCASLLREGAIDVVIGYGEHGPVFIRRAEDVQRLVWNDNCGANLASYLKRREVRALGRPGVVVHGAGARSIVVLERESQIAPDEVVPIPAERNQPRPGHAALDALLAAPPEQRMAYWTLEFERCVKCYACRQVCPMCYCERCLADKNQPAVIDTSPTLKGNFAWHITRAFHLAGRCVGCGECTRACPAGVDLKYLNQALAIAAEKNFGYRAGVDPAAEPPLGAFAMSDREDFIR